VNGAKGDREGKIIKAPPVETKRKKQKNDHAGQERWKQLHTKTLKPSRDEVQIRLKKTKAHIC